MRAYSRERAFCKQYAWTWGLNRGGVNRVEGAKLRIYGMSLLFDYVSIDVLTLIMSSRTMICNLSFAPLSGSIKFF